MRVFVLMLASATLISTAAASAGDESASPQTAVTAQPAAAAPDDMNKMECRMMGAKTGSRLGGHRECRTKREWEDIRHQDEHEVEKMQARDAMVRH